MQRRILNFGQFITVNESSSSNTDGIGLTSFLKKYMWNESVKLMYGPGYKGDPAKDDTKLIVGGNWFSGHSEATMGELFTDAWEETDQFCERAAEFMATGSIGDFWGTAGQVAKWTAITGLVGAAIVASGGAAAGAIAGLAEGAGAAFGASLGLASISTSTYLTGAGISAAAAGLAASGYFMGKSQNIDPELYKMAQIINDKQGFIKEVKSAIEDHSDFESDWGLDDWLPALQAMPGYSKSPLTKDKTAEQIGYVFSYMIAEATYTYFASLFAASVFTAVNKYDKSDNSDNKSPNSVNYNRLFKFFTEKVGIGEVKEGKLIAKSGEDRAVQTIINNVFNHIHKWKSGEYNTDSTKLLNHIKESMGSLWKDEYWGALENIVLNRDSKEIRSNVDSKRGSASNKSSSRDTSNIKIDDEVVAGYGL